MSFRKKIKNTWMPSVAKNDLNKNDKISYDNIIFSWRPKEILPEFVDSKVGKKLKKNKEMATYKMESFL